MVKRDNLIINTVILPENWETKKFDDCVSFLKSNSLSRSALNYNIGQTKSIHYGDVLIKYGFVLDCKNAIIPFVTDETTIKSCDLLNDGDIIVADTAEDEAVGKVVEMKNVNSRIISGQHTILCRPDNDTFSPGWLGYFLNSKIYHDQLLPLITGTKVSSINKKDIRETTIIIPPKKEQTHIVNSLHDIDVLISSLEKLIDKKRAIKQGAMQELLTGKRRLKGFEKPWIKKEIRFIADVLDDCRIPIKDSIRKTMNGRIPYCGANGVLDYVNDYTIDDDIILIAEDGGHFDEYLTRPISYRMKGKCWVNNHAHILKAKSFVEQDFLYYCLKNKDIRNYITSGTRAKLNKSELLKIEIDMPEDLKEQKAISNIIDSMESEVELLEKKLKKAHQIMQGMMEQLLTGKIRLI